MPLMRRGSSTRFIARPKYPWEAFTSGAFSVVVTISTTVLSSQRARPRRRCVSSRCIAEVAVQRVADLVARRRAVSLEELNGGHYHARRAVTALEAMAFPEAFLDGMQLPVAREALDGPDL